MRLVSFVTAIVIGFGCSANAGEQPPSELLAACDQAAAAASRLQAVVECPLLCRFSAAGMTVSPRTPMAGGRKPPRHEIAGSWAPARQRALCGFNVGAVLDGKRDASARRRHVCIPENRRECSGASRRARGLAEP
jgi:hypothetical protein